MDEGCRREVDDLEEVLGVGALPLSQAVRLLGGRLPAVAGDEVELDDGGAIEVRRRRLGGHEFVSPQTRGGWSRWRELGRGRGRMAGGSNSSSHTSSVPGEIRLENSDGRWAELELTRLEWPERRDRCPICRISPPCAGW